MSSRKSNDPATAHLHKNPFSVSQLTVGLFFGTYFLTVEMIEFSLSKYAAQQNKVEFYQNYLLFKRNAPIWKWWQLITTLTIPLSLITVVQDLFGILTKKATKQRHLLDIIAAIHLFSILYVTFKWALPLENQIVHIVSVELANELHVVHHIIFLLNIVGWCIPIFRYREWKNDEYYHRITKTE